MARSVRPLAALVVFAAALAVAAGCGGEVIPTVPVSEKAKAKELPGAGKAYGGGKGSK